MENISEELKKIKLAFNKVKLDIVRMERNQNKYREEQKQYTDNVEKMINDRIDALTKEFKREIREIKKSLEKKSSKIKANSTTKRSKTRKTVTKKEIKV